ncbi:glycosyltransferase family 8 protein [Helicobacter sp. MIT 05-5293]|nr:glycosyltransferase family 8 protein [Helicobacter sp. MIT 05-5293]
MSFGDYNDTTQHNTTQHNTTQHNTTQHNTILNLDELGKLARVNHIPIIFASDENYAKYLSVAVQSIKEHINPIYHYDIFVLETDITESTKLALHSMQNTNLSIYFIDIKPKLASYDTSLFTLNYYLTIEAYYRLFIPQIFQTFEKVLYVDCDITFRKDIAELYHTNMEDFLVAAVRDVGLILNVQVRELEMYRAYIYETLQLSNVSDYFNSGLMLFNLRLMREVNLDLLQLGIGLLQKGIKTLYSDQSILNYIFKDKVKYLPHNWNHLIWHTEIDIPTWKERLANTPYYEFICAYEEASKDPYTLHYKPWNKLDIAYGYEFWRYARLCPLYEIILHDHITHKLSLTIKEYSYLPIYKAKLKRYRILNALTFGKFRKFQNRKNELKQKISNMEK